MNKFNKDNLIKIIILFGFTLFFSKIIITGEINNYVHPRIIPFVYFAIVGFILMIISEVKKLISKEKINLELKKYAVFGVALIFIFYMELDNPGGFNITSANITYQTLEKNNINQRNSVIGKNTSSKSDIDNSTNDENSTSEQYGYGLFGTSKSNNKQLDETNGIITIRRDNYAYSLDEILSNPEKYDNKKIEISGFIYKDSTLKNNEFILGRYMMVCCAADLQIAGVKCSISENEEVDLNNDTWVIIKGTISNVDGEAVIKADTVEIDENPDKQYVYPF